MQRRHYILFALIYLRKVFPYGFEIPFELSKVMRLF